MAAIDLNLIRVFVIVYESRNLTQAAQDLYVTQSAISQSLSRLRKHFGDPLFERLGRRMEPTPVAQEAYLDMRAALDSIDTALGRVQRFDPSTSDKVFRIALSELGEIGWMGNILGEVRRSAPNVRIESIALDQARFVDWLERGFVDVAVAPADLSGGFVRTRVKDQSYVAVCSRQPPGEEVPLSLERFSALPRITVSGDSAADLLETAERQAGVFRDPTATVERFAALPSLLRSNPGYVAVIPRPIAEGWAHAWDLELHDLPFEVPPVRLHVCRRSTVQSQSALDWFYSTVIRAVVATPADFGSIHVDGS